jgi:hypothetical protein
MIEPVPPCGPLRVAWWSRLYEVLADDADAQRAEFVTRNSNGPGHPDAWFEDGYREHLHDLVDHAVDRRVWAP